MRPLGGVIVAGFFMFWIVFVFLFRKRLPKADSRRQDRGPDESPHLAYRVRRRREEDGGDHGGEIGEGGGGGDGGVPGLNGRSLPSPFCSLPATTKSVREVMKVYELAAQSRKS